MPFRARVNPATLARRRAVALSRAVAPLPPPHPISLSSAPATAGPGPSTLRARAFHTSPPHAGLASLFGFKKGRSTPADAVLTAASSGSRDLPRLWRAYADSTAAPTSRLLAPHEVLALLQSIEREYSLNALDPLIKPLAAVAVHAYESTETTGELHTATVRVLTALPVEFGHQKALDIASAHPEAMGAGEWEGLIGLKGLAERLVPILPADDRMFHALGEVRRSSGLSRADVEDFVELMQRKGATAGPWTEVSLAQMYTAVGDHKAASGITKRWPNASESDSEGDGELANARWRARLWIAVQRSDVALVRSLLAQRREAPPDALSFLVFAALPPSPSSADVIGSVQAVSDELGLVFPSDAWDAVVHVFLLRTTGFEGLRHVWALYRYARGLDMRAPSPTLAMGFIDALTRLEPPLFAEAMEVYADLNAREESVVHELNIELYHTLLDSALVVPQTSAVREAVLSLLSDMAASPHRFDKAYAASLVQSLWERFATDHPSAYDLYDATLSVSAPLDVSQWESLLLKFIALSFPSSAVATPEIIVRMISDMRASGYAPSPKILTRLLASYAGLAKSVTRTEGPTSVSRIHGELLSATRNIQSLLNLDSALEVNVRLLTALMDSLQATGAFDDALGVWAEIVRLSTNTDRGGMGAAVGVMLDACGHAGQSGRGDKVFAWARKRRYIKNERDWAPYVEMLARCGRFNEAVDALAQMEREGIRPGFKVALTPLRFARGVEGQAGVVRKRLAEALPYLEERLFREEKD